MYATDRKDYDGLSAANKFYEQVLEPYVMEKRSIDVSQLENLIVEFQGNNGGTTYFTNQELYTAVSDACKLAHIAIQEGPFNIKTAIMQKEISEKILKIVEQLYTKEEMKKEAED